MALKTIRFAFLAVPLMIAATGTIPTMAQDNGLPSSGQFWACETGFTIQTNGNAARCIKAGGKLTFDPGSCVLSEKRVDYRGNVDACVAGPIAGDMICKDPTTRMEVRRGLDVCVKTVAPTVRQPRNEITRR